MTYEVTSLSHYMRDRFPGNGDSPPWLPLVVGTYAVREDAEAHIERIRQANGGVMPSDRTLAIREVEDSALTNPRL